MSKSKIECAHCHGEGGAEGTIWCAQCLEWWRQKYAGIDTPDPLGDCDTPEVSRG